MSVLSHGCAVFQGRVTLRAVLYANAAVIVNLHLGWGFPSETSFPVSSKAWLLLKE